jgi:hypothetical protein
MTWITAQSPSNVMMGIQSRLMANALNYSLSQIPRISRKWMSSTFLSWNDYFHRLRDLNSVVIPILGFPFSNIFFSKFSFQISKIRGRSELSDLHGNFGKIPEFLGTKCVQPATLLGRSACPWALFDLVLSYCILHIERSTFILWNGKILRKRGVLSL